jgi:hypothetical protein
VDASVVGGGVGLVVRLCVVVLLLVREGGVGVSMRVSVASCAPTLKLEGRELDTND